MTVETPSKGSSFLTKRYLNIPVLYWGAGAATILAFAAWKMKPMEVDAPTEPVEDFDQGGALSESYPDMPTGTVIVAPQPPEQDNSLDNASIEDNETWLKRGVSYLVNQRGYGAGAAQSALQAYLEGNDMSYSQGVARDAVIRELGMPPIAPSIGKTGYSPARIQGPLPRYHEVKGANDNSVSKIAQLYYGRSDKFATDAIVNSWAWKTKMGGRSASNLTAGTKVWVPNLPTPKTTTPTITNKTPTPQNPDSNKGGNPTVAGFQVKRRGDKGRAVGYLQWYLGIKADNVFGVRTESALKAWQRKHGLPATGVADRATWVKISQTRRAG